MHKTRKFVLEMITTPSAFYIRDFSMDSQDSNIGVVSILNSHSFDVISHCIITLIRQDQMEIEQLNRLNEVFSFRQSRSTANRLVNKNIPGVTVEELTHTVECKDTESEPTVIRAENPLETDGCLGYFEAEVLGTSGEDTINIGLTAKDNTTKQHLGRTNNSFGYYRGDLFLNKRKVGAITPPEKLKEGDYLGIGINCHKRTFFLVKNGKIMIEGAPVPTSWTEYYPAVGVSHQNEKVKLTFNPKDYKFDYLSLVKDIQKEVQGDIKKEQISSSKIYPLVHEYLQFHGYSKTLAMLTERQKDFHKLPKLCKHPGVVSPDIDLTSKQSQQMIGEDEEMNAPLKGRHRIMSQILGEKEEANLVSEIKRKNTEMMDQKIRKDSVFSNMSNISNYEQSEGQIVGDFYREEEQKEMQDELNQNQKFLLNEKGEIVRLIKEKKIEQAIEIIQKKIPELFAREEIKTIMKGHIFLRMVKQESNRAALMFSQSESLSFSKHAGSLFPFYSSKKLDFEWNPFKQIYLSLAYNAINAKNSPNITDMVSDKQFQCFSSYINSLILKKMGYIGVSRLGFCVNNAKKVLEKLQNYKGMSCGIELKI